MNDLKQNKNILFGLLLLLGSCVVFVYEKYFYVTPVCSGYSFFQGFSLILIILLSGALMNGVWAFIEMLRFRKEPTPKIAFGIVVIAGTFLLFSFGNLGCYFGGPIVS